MASRPKLTRLAYDRLPRELVEAKLEERLSPEQIAAELPGISRPAGEVGVARDDLPSDLHSRKGRAPS